MEAPLDRDLAPDECWVGLIAVHDACRDPREWISPADSVPFILLRNRALELKESQLPDLREMLDRARASVGPANPLQAGLGHNGDNNTSSEQADGRQVEGRRVGSAYLPPDATRRPPTPPGVAELPPPPTRPRLPNETTEQPVIDALHRLGAIGVKGLRDIDKKKRPTGERLAPIAIGRACDGQFKTTLAHMVDLGWLGNGREHGLVGGYFLTPVGVTLVTKRK